MKIFFACLVIISIAACKTKPFVKHSVSFEKVSDKCVGRNEGIHMNSNLNGERYEFQSCLDADFKKEQVSSTQQNDTTIVLKFERKNAKQALYNLTIDLDAYPRYSLLIIDGTPIRIKPYEN